MGNIDRCPTYKGGKVTEVVVYANYIGLRRFYRYVVTMGRWSPYEVGQLDKFHCTSVLILVTTPSKAWVCGLLRAGTGGSNPVRGMDICTDRRCELSGTGLCDGLIIRPED